MEINNRALLSRMAKTMHVLEKSGYRASEEPLLFFCVGLFSPPPPLSLSPHDRVKHSPESWHRYSRQIVCSHCARALVIIRPRPWNVGFHILPSTVEWSVNPTLLPLSPKQFCWNCGGLWSLDLGCIMKNLVNISQISPYLHIWPWPWKGGSNTTSEAKFRNLNLKEEVCLSRRAWLRFGLLADPSPFSLLVIVSMRAPCQLCRSGPVP